MALPAIIPPLIAAGSAIGGTAFNIGSQNSNNRKSRQWSEKMYAQQRYDNERQWHMQNAYNSPTMQMARLRDAGLNPNLVYEKGAAHQAGPISGSSAPSWNPQAPQMDLAPVGSSLANYFDIQVKQAQADNLKAQNTVAIQEAALKAAQIANTNQSTARSKFDLDLANDLRQTSMDAARANLHKINAETDMSLAENERRAAVTAQSLQEGLQRILLMREQTANTAAERYRIREATRQIKTNANLQQLDEELKRNGINPNDPLYLRILGRTLNSIMDGSLYDNAKNKISDWWKNRNK